jgi:hypothetical protein
MRNARWVAVLAAAAVLGLVAAACAGASAGTDPPGAGSGLSLGFASPADGATVSEPFTVKFDSSVPLGDPSTGEHHVHLCIDVTACGSKYTIVYGTSVTVSDLSPGPHTLLAAMANADHSPAGPTAMISITVGPATGGTGSTGGTGGSTGGTGGSTGGGYGGY